MKRLKLFCLLLTATTLFSGADIMASHTPQKPKPAPKIKFPKKLAQHEVQYFDAEAATKSLASPLPLQIQKAKNYLSEVPLLVKLHAPLKENLTNGYFFMLVNAVKIEDLTPLGKSMLLDSVLSTPQGKKPNKEFFRAAFELTRLEDGKKALMPPGDVNAILRELGQVQQVKIEEEEGRREKYVQTLFVLFGDKSSGEQRAAFIKVLNTPGEIQDDQVMHVIKMMGHLEGMSFEKKLQFAKEVFIHGIFPDLGTSHWAVHTKAVVDDAVTLMEQELKDALQKGTEAPRKRCNAKATAAGAGAGISSSPKLGQV